MRRHIFFLYKVHCCEEHYINGDATRLLIVRHKLIFVIFLMGNWQRKSVVTNICIFRVIFSTELNLLVRFRQIVRMDKAHRRVRGLALAGRHIHNSDDTLSLNVNFTDYDADQIVCHVASCHPLLVHRRHCGRIQYQGLLGKIQTNIKSIIIVY